MKRVLFITIVTAILFVAGCKKDEVFPSVEGTTWEVTIKWTFAADSVTFYTRYDAGGSGVEVTSGGTPTGPTFTWSQDDQTINWNYGASTTLTGTIADDSKTMTGTGTTTGGGGGTSGWRAVVH